jgi:agmatinase
VYSGPPEGLADLVDARVEQVLERKQIPIVLGGEHSVSIGAINAAANHYRNLSVLQIDAHGDTRESYMGSTHNHACVMARARERCKIVQVGIRAIDAEELKGMNLTRVFFAHDIVRTTTEWMDHVVELLTDDVYVTVDLDGFDPSIIPATGTPEPGGLDWYTVNELLRRVIEQRTIRAFDVVELLPLPGEHASAFIAAKLTYRILSMMFAGR